MQIDTERLPLVDSIRGFALILMAVYHFSFDLDYFKIININMDVDIFWTSFRSVIMTLFTGTVGISLYLSRYKNSNSGHSKRLLKIGFCSILISALTFFAFNKNWVFFGILHLIFIISFLSPMFTKKPKLAGTLGLVFILIPVFYRNFWFIKKPWIIIGLSPVKPNTFDFAPLLPWVGVALIGILVGQLLQMLPTQVTKIENKFLSFLGKRSLVFYMIHQIVLFPLAWLLSYLK